MIKCIVCNKEVSKELIQDFHDDCMNIFVKEMNELKKINPQEWESLKQDFYSKE